MKTKTILTVLSFALGAAYALLAGAQEAQPQEQKTFDEVRRLGAMAE